MGARLAVLTAVALTAALALAQFVEAARPPSPSPATPRCHRFGAPTPGDNNQFIQVAAKSGGTRTDDVSTINGLDFKLAHVDVASQIVAPTSGAYCYSVGGFTTSGRWLQMGYMVLAGENGLARWFVQVLDTDGTTLTWKLSRAGEANPPPACSACSGGSTDGYPFGFNSIMQGKWTFYFDGISKAKVDLGSDTALDSSRLYYIGEVSAANAGAQTMQPRVTLRTLTLWSNAERNWRESSSASAEYYCSPGASNCDSYGIEHPPAFSLLPNRIRFDSDGDGQLDAPLHPDGCYGPAQNHPGEAHMSGAGSGVTRTAAAGPLWDNSDVDDLCANQ
jgi:hypothetical protein